MKFAAKVPFSPPDAELYAELKHLTPIQRQPADELTPIPEGARIPSLATDIFGAEMALTWTTFTLARLQAAALGHRNQQRLPAAFPGRLLPGPKKGGVLDRGCLQIEWLRHAHELHQSVKVDQVYRRLDHTPLRVLQLFDAITRQGVWEGDSLREAVLLRGLLHDHDLAEAFTWIDALWSPGQPLPKVRPNLLAFAHDLVRPFRKQSPDALALLLEIHDVIRRLEALLSLNITPVGMGVFQGVWCEVGLMKSLAIRATELVQTPRAIQELEALPARGFAPIAVNEWGCNVDGSHRQVATILWNALCAAHKRRRPLDIEDAVNDFVNRHLDEMGQLLSHEVVRVFTEALFDMELRPVLDRAYAAARADRSVVDLPVILVPEWSAATVIKSSYDDYGTSIRVCPSVYALLASERCVTLPARGPYHRTDSFLLPWFKVAPDD